MTRDYKKHAELHYLREYLRAAGVSLADDGIVEGERPDFLITTDGITIGVEITDFHTTGPRREVEEHWQTLRQWPMALIDYPQFRSVALNFKGLRLPARQHMQAFVGEVIALTSGPVSALARIIPDPAGHPIAAQYLDDIEIEPSKLQWLSWRWNQDIAWIGVEEEELLAIVAGKARSVATPASSYWLIITEGPGLSRVMAFMDHRWLEPMVALTSLLEEGPFDRLILLQSPIIEWRRGSGWSTSGET